ncbi:MAG: phosphatase PAP2 family protein [Bacilli bacterium]|nr:phosphatase PAP2 family protein [Bacilli bacterium]
MKRNKYIILSIIFTIISAVYTFMVKKIDIQPIGPKGSKVGFASLNKVFRDTIGTHMKLYKLAEILGLAILVIVGIYALIGLYQLIKRKSLLKIDREIIILGIFYVLMFATYIFFEKCIINYRPVILDGKLEASYPSSHTILALCTCITSLIVSKKYVSKKYIKITNIITILLLFGVFLGRMFSGVHWLSDIIGGFLISLTLISYFNLMYNFKETR